MSLISAFQEPSPIHQKRSIRAHRKSRGGCVACRARKVKCSETKPCCARCARNGDECVYIHHHENRQVVHIRVPPSTNSFDMRDMRLFHDFLTASYPTLPLESDQVWTCEVPVIAQQHSFLMHAMLALGAAHLHATTNLDLEQTVQRYRTLAIRGLNSKENFDLGNNDATDPSVSLQATAVLATCFALTFASSYMGDPMGQFLVLVRGCSSVTHRMTKLGLASPFFRHESSHAMSEMHMEVMRERLRNATPACPELAKAARKSLEQVQKSCTLQPFEQQLLRCMQDIVASASDPIIAYGGFVRIWNMFADMGAEDFDYFSNSHNLTSLVLQVHFLALDVMVRPWLETATPNRRSGNRLLRNSMQAFENSLSGRTGVLSHELLEWPRHILEDDPSQRLW